MLVYTILITSSPYNTEKAIHAFYVAKTLLQSQKNIIKNIFFYGDGVLHGNNMVYPLKEKMNLLHEWHTLKKKFFINLNICSSSAQERGIISNNIGEEIGFLHGNLHSSFRITGLGILIQSILNSDRLLQF